MGSMNLDHLVNHVFCSQSDVPTATVQHRAAALAMDGVSTKKTVDEVWRDIQRYQELFNTHYEVEDKKPSQDRQPTLGEITLPAAGVRQIVVEIWLYYTRVKLGTPRTEYYVQVDTSSDHLSIACISCDDCPRSSGLGYHYHVDLTSITVDGQLLAIDPEILRSPQSHGTILDSRTTYMYLVEDALQPIINAILQHIPSTVSPFISIMNDQCFMIPKSNFVVFPNITLFFEGNVPMMLQPENYLIRKFDLING